MAQEQPEMASTASENPWLHHPDLSEAVRKFVVPGEHCYDGIWCTRSIPASSLDRVKTFEFRDDDVILVTYPKSGTQWMTKIMMHLLHIEENTLQAQGFNYVEMDLSHSRPVPPFIDIIESLPSPRTYSSHLFVDYFRRPLEKRKTKFVVVMRNVKDALVSFYHFYRSNPFLGQFKGTFDEFMEMVKVKRVRSWFDWVLGWGEYKDYPNTIFIRYEDMKKDLPSELRRLANFLEIEVTDEIVADVCDKTSFSNMKDSMNALGITDSKISPFMRKGEVGDWKNYFSDDFNNYVDELYKDVESIGLHFDFE